MKNARVGFVASFLGALVAIGCGGAGTDDPVGQSGQDLSTGSSSSAPKPTPTGSTSAAVCGEDQKLCKLESSSGACIEKCVPDTYLCVLPPASCDHVVCDPLGGPPHAGCEWSTTACQWDCPVCDPVGTPPRAGCQWSSTACEWQCPVCDPPPPPEKEGCVWDEKACVWLCL